MRKIAHHFPVANSDRFITEEHGYVLLSIVALALECVAIGFLGPGRIRKNIFNERFMKENFEAIHNSQLNQEIKENGYPDNGNGRYSQLLQYSEWYHFNNAQRAHLNFVQQIATCLALIFIGGLYTPKTQACFGLVMFLGRIIYTVSYINNGPSGRRIGAIIWDIGLVASIVLALMSSIKLIMGK